MTRIGIIGMGKMGQTIASLLENRPEVSCHTFSRISTQNLEELNSCDVVIEFTIPEAAPGVIRQCLELGVPIVSGTTGWHESHLETMLTLCKRLQGTFLYATNFSVGMNIVFALNRKLASVMAKLPEFKPSLKEIHHIQKKDAPSGTAYTLLEDMILHNPSYSHFVLNESADKIPVDSIPVTAIREGEVKGYHEINYDSGLERITISHEAHDRKIFAEGAILAALWLGQQPAGIYTMRDIIKM